MPTTRHVLRRPHRSPLSFSQMEELWLGVGHRGPSFESDEHRRAAWFRHREKLMRLWGRDGRRPMGWWCYEAPEKGLRYPGLEHERSILYEEGVLSEAERTMLERQWREDFERSWSPNFSFFSGGKVYSGDDARELFWIWADLPPPLHEKWMEERERRGRVVRDLETKAAEANTEGEAEPGAARA